METADYSVLPKYIFSNVYEPAEDTFILIDALEKDFELIKKLRPCICLEIGSGSGVVISSLGKALGPACYLCTDINPLAASASRATSQSNHVPADVIVTDLAIALETRLEHSVDILIFNPPYALSPSEEVGADHLSRATSGGAKGREVMNRLFPVLPKLLSPGGLFYLTCISQNDIQDIASLLLRLGLRMTVVVDRRCGIEHLFVLRFSLHPDEPLPARKDADHTKK